MAKVRCMGCNKPIGGLVGAFGVKLMSGQVCLTCRDKLEKMPNYQLISPEQAKAVIKKETTMQDVAEEIQRKYNGGSSKSVPPAEEIRQFKALLDEGLITEDEYEHAKNRILGR
jgi:hypothetical protein